MSRNRYRILSHNLSRSQHRVSRNGDRSLFHNRSRHQHWLPKANNANRSARNVKPSAPSPGKFLIQTNHQRRSPRKSVSLNLVQGHQIPRNEKPQQVPRSGKNEPVHGNKTNHSIMGLHINFSRKSILSLFCGMHGWCSSGLQAILLLRTFNTHLTIITIRNEHCIRPHYLAYNKAQNEKRKAAKLKAKQAAGNWVVSPLDLWLKTCCCFF